MMSKTIHIGNVIRHATVFNFQKHHDTIMNTDALLGAVEQLFMLLHGRHIDYLLVGGIAMLQYVQGRNAEDIDLIIASASLQKLPEITLTSQDDHFARGTFNALQIDFRLTTPCLCSSNSTIVVEVLLAPGAQGHTGWDTIF